MRARTPPQKIEHDSSQPRPSSTRESSLEGETEEDEKTRRASEEDDDHDDRDRDARGRTRDRARARRRGADDVDADASDASDDAKYLVAWHRPCTQCNKCNKDGFVAFVDRSKLAEVTGAAAREAAADRKADELEALFGV